MPQHARPPMAEVGARLGRLRYAAAALASGPTEVMDFLLPLWAAADLGATPAAIGLVAAVEAGTSLSGDRLAVSLAARRAGRVHQRVESRGGTCGPVRKRSASTRVKLWPVPSRRMRGRRVMRRPLCGFGQQE